MADLPNNMDLLHKDLKALKSEADFQGKNIELKRWLFEQRLTYAWNFFDFHAKQRMSMFNFFLIFVGFVISAYATLLKDGYCTVSSILAFTATVLTCFFIRLERRNEELVFIAEDVLTSLECDVLFEGYNREVVWPHRRSWWLGQMNKKQELKPSGIFRRQKEEDKEFKPSKNEHGKWLPRFQIAIVVIFGILAVLPWLPKNITVHTIPIGIGTCK